MRKQINNLMIAFAFISTLGCLVGCVKQDREKSRQEKIVASSSIKEDKKAIKQKQLAHLKEHEQEIVDFVKAQNPKVESVQINWDETEWGVAGNGTPQGGDEMILIFGGINQNPESSWRVDVVVEDGKINLKTMSLGQYLRMGGRIFE
ncbi:lipoprotein BUG3 [Streptococcus parasanguinis]|uniref:lipoprotein BUG3 n=1 Tax=Streptococcus parasanguinis TaxID=1318 RepID=UPI0039C46F6C